MSGSSQGGRVFQHTLLLTATIPAAIVNGLDVSPLYDPVFFLLRPFVPPPVSYPAVLYYVTTVFIAAMTLALAGIPAALFERWRGHRRSTRLSLGIWLAFALILSLPGILGASGYFSIED